jgi:hypothetical protein
MACVALVGGGVDREAELGLIRPEGTSERADECEESKICDGELRELVPAHGERRGKGDWRRQWY